MAPINPRFVTPDFAVHGQITKADLAMLRQAGFASIINNRPDGEEPGQPSNASLAAEAAALGLRYLSIPIAGAILPEAFNQLRQFLLDAPPPVLAFCRSGARSTRLWAHAMQGQLSHAEILAAASKAGMDGSSLASELNA